MLKYIGNFKGKTIYENKEKTMIDCIKKRVAELGIMVRENGIEDEKNSKDEIRE